MRDIGDVDVNANRLSKQVERAREQTGFASRDEERKALCSWSEMVEASFYFFSVESLAGELSKGEASDMAERLEVFDVLD